MKVKSFFKQYVALTLMALYVPIALQGATTTVTTTADSGVGSLRKAISDVNAGSFDTIEFNIAGAGPHVITPATDYDAIVKAVVINGYSQPGASANTAAIDEPVNAVIKIVIQGGGSLAGPFAGITLGAGSDGSVIKGLAINTFERFPTFSGAAISIVSSDNNSIEGNFLGTDVSGMQVKKNYRCVVIDSGNNNTIGGSTPDARNIIGGSQLTFRTEGGAIVTFGGSENVIKGNFIGINKTGAQAFAPSLIGILLNGSDKTTIGGPSSADRNIIAGYNHYNIGVSGSTNTVIEGNYIGCDITGSKAFEGGGHGIFIQALPFAGPTSTNTRIQDNLVSGNLDGIFIGRPGILSFPVSQTTVEGNIIGTDVTGSKMLGNTRNGINVDFAIDTEIRDNLVSSNQCNGIRVAEGTQDTFITGNLIGTNASGLGVLGNQKDGIHVGVIQGEVSNTFIGGFSDSERNVISGNKGNGINVRSFANNTQIRNNFIGSSVTGDEFARPNEKIFGNCKKGILLQCTSNNIIEDNLIENNKDDGIKLDCNANQNVIQGNVIHDNKGDGVAICDSSCNLVGGAADFGCSIECDFEEGNIIRDNCGDGVSITEKCAIAVDNTIVSNSIFDNKDDGITLNKKKCCKDKHGSHR